ncbi:hypothetical protein [Mucilaginibacter phyllosphaerae]|uniref:Preprotein translocase subunit YajC n=1 Tax=Mucilaginibacter phyllosphaerae TaxID=1812349 RepID=A0ABR6I9K1_9SPHI|nr:hypothetical protein [Mucilaginibacter phyllosphaerae]MBB3969471.1 preprotein translocase subunit YajC [Mucilaginibacter phyllosphaerae]GGH08814.1 hypothetical protein GCM10007352_14010 [Mucilaginibacter phyllosphaerae]
MDNSTGYVKGQKVITPAGEGQVLDVAGDEVTVQLESGVEKSFSEADLQDDSDAG